MQAAGYQEVTEEQLARYRLMDVRNAFGPLRSAWIAEGEDHQTAVMMFVGGFDRQKCDELRLTLLGETAICSHSTFTGPPEGSPAWLIGGRAGFIGTWSAPDCLTLWYSIPLDKRQLAQCVKVSVRREPGE